MHKDGHKVIGGEAACWAHVQRPFHDLHLTGKASPTTEALQRTIAAVHPASRVADLLPLEFKSSATEQAA